MNKSSVLTIRELMLFFNNTRFPKIALLGIVKVYIRPRGRPPKRWTDCQRESCGTKGVTSLARVRRMAEDRRTWRAFIRNCLLDSVQGSRIKVKYLYLKLSLDNMRN